MIMRSKYKGTCSTCHYTIWRGEDNYNGKPTHLDCKTALTDKSARELDPCYLGIYGKVNKKKLRDALQHRASGPVAGGKVTGRHKLLEGVKEMDHVIPLAKGG